MKNDVYRFRYSEEFIKQNPNRDLYHCFDGILIEKERNGVTYYEDTYWSSDNRTFNSMDEIKTKGDIKFLCNLGEMEEINEWKSKYYNKEDVVFLGIHKGYRAKYLIKKGTEMSKDVVIQGLKNKIVELENDIRYNTNKIEWLKKDIENVESGKKQLNLVSF
jgi:hypothetical protein